MNPLLQKFSVFTEFTKYEYREISKPNQTLKTKIKNFWLIFSNWKYKTTFLRDMKSLTQKSSKEVPRFDKLKLYLNLYKISEILIGAYAIHSLYWHYKNKYFHSGRKIIEIYILAKIIINLLVFNGISFFFLKNSSDPIMFDYYSKKEEEWEDNLKRKHEEIKSIKEDIDMRLQKKEKSRK